MYTPRDVVLFELSDPPPRLDVLAEELAIIGPAVVESRRRDFLIGRHCARNALRILGVEAGPIPRGPSREPIWPTGVCGSITHCHGYWAAAVAWQSNFRSIGIDAEPIRQLAPEVVRLIASESEIERNRQAHAGIPWELLNFSAKESVYKAWFPLMRRWLGFEEVEVELATNSGDFQAVITPGESNLRRMQGRFQIGERRVFTCAFV